jgi:hypothetical protein
MDTTTVDGGLETVPLVFAIPIEGMQKGDTRSMHIGGEFLRQAAHLKHIDLLNPHKATIQIESTAGKLGVSLAHDDKGNKKLITPSRVVHVNMEGKEATADAYHAMSTAHPGDSHVVHIEPVKDMDDTILKRVNQTWGNMTSANVAAGVHKSTLGDETRYLITETADDGTKSAIHQLLMQNSTNAKFLGGKYTTNKMKKSSINGKQAIVMNSDDFNIIKDTMHKTLETKSPFKDGLRVTVHKLDDRPTSRHATNVHLTLHRTPLHSENGFVANSSRITTHSHINALTGTDGESKVAAVTSVAPGFEDVVGAKDALHTQAHVEAYTMDGDSETSSEDED